MTLTLNDLTRPQTNPTVSQAKLLCRLWVSLRQRFTEPAARRAERILDLRTAEAERQRRVTNLITGH